MSEFDEWWNESRFLVGDAHKAFARRAWDAALAKREAVDVPDICNAYESGVGHRGRPTAHVNPYPAGSAEHEAYAIGAASHPPAYDHDPLASKDHGEALAASQQAAKGEGT